MRESCSLVPLTKGGAAVGTPSLAQREAEEDAQREEEDGTQDPQAGEVVFQDPHSAEQNRSFILKTTFGFLEAVTSHSDHWKAGISPSLSLFLLWSQHAAFTFISESAKQRKIAL